MVLQLPAPGMNVIAWACTLNLPGQAQGRFYSVAEFASLGAENGYCLTIFGTENRAKITILGAEILSWSNWQLFKAGDPPQG